MSLIGLIYEGETILDICFKVFIHCYTITENEKLVKSMFCGFVSKINVENFLSPLLDPLF